MKELITIQTKLKAAKNQYNSFGKYKYRSCEDILEAVKPLLLETNCTLTISDEVKEIGGRIYVQATTSLTNAEGIKEQTTAFAREEEVKKGMDAAQITGATSSYARKYALNGLFAIDDTKDADTMDNSKASKSKASTPNSGVNEEENIEFGIVLGDIERASDKVALKDIYDRNTQLHADNKFMEALSARRKKLGI